MKIVTNFTIISLVGLVLSAPTSKNTIDDDDDDGKLVITKEMYTKDDVKYSGNHEIINLLVPINNINANEPESSEYNTNSNEVDTGFILFFVEADTDLAGNRIDKGLYIYKDGKATKLLEHGRDAAASSDDSQLVFFGAADGIYVYNLEKNSTDKYGTVDDSIINIAKENASDIIYILTEKHELFKVSDNGMTKEKIDDVVNAKQIVMDYTNNIYFYSDDKQAYARTVDGIKKIEGLPENPSSVYLVKPPFFFLDCVIFIVDNAVYLISSDGTSIDTDIEVNPKAKPSAYAPEVGLVQYYAYDKKIYEFNILAIVLEGMKSALKDFLDENADDIRSLTTKSKVPRQRLRS